MKKSKNIVVVGAGIGGRLLKKDIEKNYPWHKVIGFADDKRARGRGVEMLGEISELAKINKLYKVDEMVIAIPSADGKLIRKIILANVNNKIPIKIVPRSHRIISLSQVNYQDVKDVDLEDFLGGRVLKRNVEKLKNFYKNRTVLITGGAGSIGSEIVRQLLDLDIKKVVVYDNSEYLIFNLDQSLREKEIPAKKYTLVIGNILNYEKLDRVVKKEKPDIIFHAAAYKHVYLMEDNADEAVLNNVIGTKNVVNAAAENHVKSFIFLSTDKVVNPTSVMGATKKIAEYYVKYFDGGRTKFNIVRFGNVINSLGSVIPLFERQIEEHGYVTVTDKRAMRYFMSIREAAQLVINSAARNRQGEIFILDMGELINMYEIALCLIRSKGLIPEKDVKIRIIGLKKGEKLVEELFTKKERRNLIKIDMENTFRLKNFEKCPLGINNVLSKIEELARAHSDAGRMRSYLKKIFPSLS